MCSISIIINKDTQGVRFIGEGWAEIPCTIKEDHPKHSGEHCFENDSFKVTWNVPGDAIWLAIGQND
jgi:hypothetical protein